MYMWKEDCPTTQLSEMDTVVMSATDICHDNATQNT